MSDNTPDDVDVGYHACLRKPSPSSRNLGLQLQKVGLTIELYVNKKKNVQLGIQPEPTLVNKYSAHKARQSPHPWLYHR